MADAGRHSDLTFVSSFVSELDVAVVCVHEKVVQTFEGVANKEEKKKSIKRHQRYNKKSNQICLIVDNRRTHTKEKKTAGAEIDMTRD